MAKTLSVIFICSAVLMVSIVISGCAAMEGELDNPVKTITEHGAKGVSLKGEMQEHDRDSPNPVDIK
ncbi:MAG: hypothetical protein KAQ99_01460 [Candidatus Aureabacteria bacterium]|nr:hypothetical protein [Candidatus Auribacterota bacterium]